MTTDWQEAGLDQLRNRGLAPIIVRATGDAYLAAGLNPAEQAMYYIWGSRDGESHRVVPFRMKIGPESRQQFDHMQRMAIQRLTDDHPAKASDLEALRA